MSTLDDMENDLALLEQEKRAAAKTLLATLDDLYRRTAAELDRIETLRRRARTSLGEAPAATAKAKLVHHRTKHPRGPSVGDLVIAYLRERPDATFADVAADALARRPRTTKGSVHAAIARLSPIIVTTGDRPNKRYSLATVGGDP